MDYDFDLDDDFDLDSVVDTFVEECVVDLMNDFESEGSEFKMDWGDEDSDESDLNAEEEDPYKASDEIYQELSFLDEEGPGNSGEEDPGYPPYAQDSRHVETPVGDGNPNSGAYVEEPGEPSKKKEYPEEDPPDFLDEPDQGAFVKFLKRIFGGMD